MKYKLKKWYPSLPNSYKENKTIVVKRKIKYYPMDGSPGVFAYEVENNPEYWEPIEEHYFVTDDKVKIYEGEWYWYVTENYRLGEREFPYYSHNDNFVATFSTKEKAQQYIDNHKPKYSKRDIVQNALTAMNVSCQPLNVDKSRILSKLLAEFDINLHDVV